MGQQISDEVKEQWKDYILKQRKSGLSIKEWCARHNLQPHRFYYWVPRLFPKLSDRSAFKEIIDPPKNSQGIGISIECQGVTLHLNSGFDRSALKECIKILKEVVC